MERENMNNKRQATPVALRLSKTIIADRSFFYYRQFGITREF